MSKIRGKNTKIEVSFRHALWKAGIRGYRLGVKIAGKPDVVFPKYKVVIFCDGDFWHGYQFDKWKDRLQPYWLNKIKGNMERDRKNEKILEEQGWIVVRLWEHDIEKDMKACVNKTVQALELRGMKRNEMLHA